MKKQKFFFQKEDLMWLIVLGLLIAFAFIFDNLILDIIKQIQFPLLTAIFTVISWTFDLSWGLAIIILLIGFFTEKKVFFGAMASLVISQIIALFLKTTIPRDRPDLGSIESFPSGHASRAFSLGHYLFKVFNNQLFCVYAWLVAVSRVYLLQHFMSDVLVGAVIGVAVARVVYNLQLGERIEKLLKL